MKSKDKLRHMRTQVVRWTQFYLAVKSDVSINSVEKAERYGLDALRPSIGRKIVYALSEGAQALGKKPITYEEMLDEEPEDELARIAS